MSTREENIKKINAGLEILSDGELEQIAGGTVGQLDDLVRAGVNNPFLKDLAGLGTHVPGANAITRDLMEDFLGKIGINADISIGFLGTGLGSENNKYTDKATGQSLSHAEVLKRISAYAI